MPAHAYSNNRAHGSNFGTWFPFRNSYRNERLDDLDYDCMSQEFQPIDFRRQVACQNRIVLSV